MSTVNVADLRVPTHFFATPPKPSTLQRKRTIIAENPDQPIIIDSANRMLDGFSLLLIYLEKGVEDIPCYVDEFVNQPMSCIPINTIPVVKRLLRGYGTAESIKLPSIKPPKNVWTYTPVRTLTAQQDGKCYICGRVMKEGRSAPTVDHFFPKALGGSNSLDNLRACCKRCNLLKGQLVPTDLALEVVRAQRDAEERGDFTCVREA